MESRGGGSGRSGRSARSGVNGRVVEVVVVGVVIVVGAIFGEDEAADVDELAAEVAHML